MFKYFDKIKKLLNEIEIYEKDNIKKLVNEIVRCFEEKNKVYIFGASHAGILTQEAYYRAGGYILFNPILSEEISLIKNPINHTSKMERLSGYGTIIASNYDISKNDLLIIHSVSGRNPVSIEIAEYFKNCNAKVAVITNLKYSKSVKSRYNSKLLYEYANILIDNHGKIGDACMKINDELYTSPTSTVISASILNEIIYEVAVILNAKYSDIPFFYSANIDGGDEKNIKLYNKYKEYIVYSIK